MSNIEIYKDTKVVDVLVAQAKHEHVESDAAENAAKLIKDLASNPNPNNRYQIGQLIGFAVNEIMRPRTNWLDNLADVKRVGHGDKAQFKVRHEGIRAVPVHDTELRGHQAEVLLRALRTAGAP